MNNLHRDHPQVERALTTGYPEMRAFTLPDEDEHILGLLRYLDYERDEHEYIPMGMDDD